VEPFQGGAAFTEPDVRVCGYARPDARLLTQRLHAEQVGLYGHADDPGDAAASDYDPPAGLFLVAYLSGPVACGGWRRVDSMIGEIKRMYVTPHLRGRGIGRLILNELERDARRAGVRMIRLETGRDNHAALRLYTAAGYAPADAYMTGRNPAINRAFSKLLGA
jgi:GNAT superfamily N-acetyltransferase